MMRPILQQKRPRPGQGHTLRDGVGLDRNPDQVPPRKDTKAVGEKALRLESQDAVSLTEQICSHNLLNGLMSTFYPSVLKNIYPHSFVIKTLIFIMFINE